MTLLIAFGLSLFFSAFFSAAEMAFLSTDRIKLRDEAEQGSEPARHLLELFSDSRQFLTSLLIGNNLVNVTATALFTTFLGTRFEIWNEWIVTAILAPILIIFAETVPKAYGRYQKRKFLLEHANLIFFFFHLLSWPTRILLGASEILLGEKGRKGHRNILVSEDEFRFLIEESVRLGVLADPEKRLIERILDFERIPIERVLIPLDQVAKVELSQNVGAAKREARRSGSKVVLVYEGLPHIIIGMIYTFDLLFQEDEGRGLREYLRSPIFLSKDTSLEKAFVTLQEKRQSFALVTDARRDVIGLIQIESLIAI